MLHGSDMQSYILFLTTYLSLTRRPSISILVHTVTCISITEYVEIGVATSCTE